jgi:hypothetical protein
MTGTFRTIVIGMCFLLVAAIPQFAAAAFLSDFTGNTQFFNPSAQSDGVVNFAVYETGDSDWTDDFGAAIDAAIGELSPPLGPGTVGNGIDEDALYVYFYQIVNTNPNTLPAGVGDSALNQLELTLPALLSSVTSAGFITDYVFDDPTGVGPDGATGPAGNARLGTLADTTPGPDDVAGDHSPSEKLSISSPGTPLIGFTFLASIEPDFVQETPFDLLEIVFNPINAIPTGSWSSVFFITSNLPPIYWEAELEDGGDTHGDIPVPNPEPGTFLMTLGALACGLIGVLGARRKS